VGTLRLDLRPQEVRRGRCAGLLSIGAGAALAAWLLCTAWPALSAETQATGTAPPQPAVRPVNPFAPPQPAGSNDYQPGAVYLSDGKILVGGIRLTPGKSLLVFHSARKQYMDIPLDALRELKVNIAAMREEKEWRFKEGGSPEKIFTGKVCHRLDYSFEFIAQDGKPLIADLAQGTPVYVLREQLGNEDVKGREAADKPESAKPKTPEKLLLQPFQVGEPGQKLEEIAHITRIVLGESAQAEARSELEKQRQAKSTKDGEQGTKDKPKTEDQTPAVPTPAENVAAAKAQDK
jgi:hypothetical protein